MAEANIEIETEDMGTMSRHPLRTAGTAFLAGAFVGMSLFGVKKSQEKSSFQKFIDQLGL